MTGVGRTAAESAAEGSRPSRRSSASERTGARRCADNGDPPRTRRRVDQRPGPKELGRLGENVAAEHLTNRGIVVLSRNWRCRDGELDIVGTDRERLIVCEVKTRSGDGFGTPAEAVTSPKVERIRKLTLQWMQRYHLYWCEVRFDVVAVRWIRPGVVTVEHLEGAF